MFVSHRDTKENGIANANVNRCNVKDWFLNNIFKGLHLRSCRRPERRNGIGRDETP